MGVHAGRALAAAVVATVGLVGCSSADSGSVDATATTTAAAETPSPPPVNVRYDSVYDLRDGAEAAGISCDDWRIVAEPRHAVERAACTDEVNLSIHTDASQAAASIDIVADVMNDVIEQTSAHLVGPNWTVNCSDEVATCEQLQDELGGELDVREP